MKRTLIINQEETSQRNDDKPLKKKFKFAPYQISMCMIPLDIFRVIFESLNLLDLFFLQFVSQFFHAITLHILPSAKNVVQSLVSLEEIMRLHEWMLPSRLKIAEFRNNRKKFRSAYAFPLLDYAYYCIRYNNISILEIVNTKALTDLSNCLPKQEHDGDNTISPYKYYMWRIIQCAIRYKNQLILLKHLQCFDEKKKTAIDNLIDYLDAKDLSPYLIAIIELRDDETVDMMDFLYGQHIEIRHSLSVLIKSAIISNNYRAFQWLLGFRKYPAKLRHLRKIALQLVKYSNYNFFQYYIVWCLENNITFHFDDKFCVKLNTVANVKDKRNLLPLIAVITKERKDEYKDQ